MSSRRRFVLRLLGLAAILGILAATRVWIGQSELPATPEELAEASIDRLPGAHLGVPGMVGGLMWISVVNDFGAWWLRRNLEAQKYMHLARRVRQVARYEPFYMDPVLFSADVLAGYGERVTAAHEILLYGLSGRVRRGEIWFRLGYLAHRYYGNPEQAAGWWALGASLPEAPPYLSSLAQLIHLTRRGETHPAIDEIAIESVQAPEVRADLRMARRFAEQRRHLLQDLQAFEARFGRPPEGVAEMVRRGYWPGPPLDPWQGEVRLTKDRRDVRPSDRVPLFLREYEPVPMADPLRRGDVLRDWRPTM